MKVFEDYIDGEWVYYQNNYHDPDFLFQAYKSQYTYNAFRLKNSKHEIVVDISEITPVKLAGILKNHDNINSDIQSSDRLPRGQGNLDTDADFSGIYHIQD